MILMLPTSLRDIGRILRIPLTDLSTSWREYNESGYALVILSGAPILEISFLDPLSGRTDFTIAASSGLAWPLPFDSFWLRYSVIAPLPITHVELALLKLPPTEHIFRLTYSPQIAFDPPTGVLSCGVATLAVAHIAQPISTTPIPGCTAVIMRAHAANTVPLLVGTAAVASTLAAANAPYLSAGDSMVLSVSTLPSIFFNAAIAGTRLLWIAQGYA